MRILILNWRDVKNPQSGGAEILTYEIAKRWVKAGHKVTQLSANFGGGKTKEIINGVRVVRKGRWFTVHFLAAVEYFKNFRGKVDVVIDEVHWLPFWTRFYVKEKKVALVCEVADNLWDEILPWPLNLVGRFLEKTYLFFYRSLPFLAISPSTASDLEKRGIPAKDITILPMGISKPVNLKIYPKEKTPTLIFLGRLYSIKRPDAAILAFSQLVKKIPQAKLWIVGSGQDKYLNYLNKLLEKEGLVNKVKFFGNVPEEKKFELLSRAHLMLVPSLHEGWGLVVIEAATVGTPTIGFDVAGLRDSIIHGKTGLICQENNPSSLASNVIKLLEDKNKYAHIQSNAISWSKNFSWEKTAKKSLGLIEN